MRIEGDGQTVDVVVEHGYFTSYEKDNGETIAQAKIGVRAVHDDATALATIWLTQDPHKEFGRDSGKTQMTAGLELLQYLGMPEDMNEAVVDGQIQGIAGAEAQVYVSPRKLGDGYNYTLQRRSGVKKLSGEEITNVLEQIRGKSKAVKGEPVTEAPAEEDNLPF